MNAATSEEPVFVKTEAFEHLDYLIEHIKKGQSIRLLVQAEKGYGKSTLLDYFRRAFDDLDKSLILAGSPSPIIPDPYHPISEALTDLLRKHNIATALKATLLESSANFISLLPILGPFSSSVREFYKEFRNAEKTKLSDQYDVYYHLQSIIAKIAQKRSIIFIFSGIGLYDLASLSIISQLSISLGLNVSVVATLDPTNLAIRTERSLKELSFHLTSELNYESLSLPPFSLEQTTDFIERTLGLHKLSNLQIAAIHKKTAGQPLFLKELIAFLLQEKELQRDSNDYFFLKNEGALNEIPRKIKDLIGVRLARLQSGLREIVDVASVVGIEFDPRSVSAVANLEHLTTLRKLKEIEEIHRLVSELQLGSRHRFTHQAIREVAYESLGPALQKEHHLLIALYLEREANNEENSYPLYYHFWKAGIREKALQYLRTSAYRAIADHSFLDALERFQVLVTLRARESESFNLREIEKDAFQIGALLNATGRHDQALAQFEEILQSTRADSLRVKCLLGLAQAYYGLDNYKKASGVIKLLLSRHRSHALKDEILESHIVLTSASFMLSDVVTAKKSYRSAFKIAERTDPVAMARLHKKVNMFNKPETALPILESALRRLPTKDRVIYWEVAHNIGCNYLFQCDTEKSIEIFEESARSLESLAGHKCIWSYNNLAISHYMAGNYKEAHRALDIIDQLHTTDFNRYCSFTNRAILWALEEKYHDAETLLTESLRSSSFTILNEKICYNLGWVYSLCNKRAQAVEILLKGIPFRKGPRLNPQLAKIYRQLKRLGKTGPFEERKMLEYIRKIEAAAPQNPWPSKYITLEYDFSEVWFWE